jgi:hypothetical protein
MKKAAFKEASRILTAAFSALVGIVVVAPATGSRPDK